MLNRLITLALAGALSLGLMSGGAQAAQGSGCMPTTGTVSGLTFAQNVNAGIAALISTNSGNSAPATDCSAAPVKGQFWLDTSLTPNVLKQFDGLSWLIVGALDSTNHVFAPPVGGGTASIAAQATTDVCAAPSAVQMITGTTAITSFGSNCAAAGIRKTLIFNSATPLTYSATSLIIPGQQSYTTTPGDVADAIYLGAGNWRLVSITKIDGSTITNPAVPVGTVLFGDYANLPVKTLYGYGQAISRASYPAYTAAVTRTQTGTLSAGNNTITGLANTDGFGAGMPIEGTGIQAGTTISSVTGSTIVMSTTAVANGSQSVSVFVTGYGSGGNATTVGVKDCRGRVLAGRDAPLNVSAGRLTSGVFGAGFNAINAASSNQTETRTIATSNLPPYTPSGSLSLSTSISATANGVIVGGQCNGCGVGGGGAFGPGTNLAISFNSISTTGTFTGNAQGGTSTPFSILPPMVTSECVVVVQP